MGRDTILKLVFNNLSNRVTLILIIAFALSQFGLVQKIFTKKSLSKRDILILSLIFGAMGILGTYTGIEINGALANARVISIFVGGLIGGPKVGILSGLIAGSHRYLIDIGGFTAFSCALATLCEGMLAGYLQKSYLKSTSKVRFAFMWGVFAEIMQMLIILLFSSPRAEALELIKIIGIPMILANGFGIAVFIMITERLYQEVDNEAAHQAQLSLTIADKSLKYFRQGYNQNTCLKIASIIKEHIDIDAVAFTDTTQILAHVGVESDHHYYQIPLQTDVTKEVIENKQSKICQGASEISCLHPHCRLKSAIIVPLAVSGDVVGSLKLYKTREHAITKSEQELAIGLAQLFSTQIELSQLDIQKELLSKSELKALQSQINPHFLFNAINTISSLIRINPEEARALLLDLGKYFRVNMCQSTDLVSIHKEIEHVKSYVNIEKARFKHKLNVIYNIDPKLNFNLPAFIIQPLVENAIKHGIYNQYEGGTVSLDVQRNNNYISVEVKDDGIGMSDETLTTLYADSFEEKIGLKNVNERLLNIYGPNSELKINSKYGLGTSVLFNIPYTKENYHD